MKKIFLPIIFLLLLFPSITNTATITQSELDKMVKTPSLQIKIPGLNFSDSIKIVEEDNKTYLYNTFFQEYIVAVYKYSVIAISVLAVIMIIFAGIQWLTSGGSQEKIGSAKKRIIGAIIGLLLATGSYIILYTINPYLVGFSALKTQYLPEEFIAEYAMSSEIGNNSLTGVVGVIPQLTDGKYSVNLTVPSADSCSNVCTSNQTRCADQSLRDMAYEAQTKTGYPAAVLLAQYMIEGSTFGLTCSGSFVPSEKNDQSAIKAANCDTTKCMAGFTWECTNKKKYTSEIKAARDLKDGKTINCGSGDKINLGYVRVSGYRCFRQPVSSGNKFAPLVEYYERHKCFKEKKEIYGGDPTAYAKAVQACGYATSQTYAQGLIDAMNKYCFLEKTNVTPVSTPVVSPPSTQNQTPTTNTEIKLVGHRGSNGPVVPNTGSAFNLGARRGYFALEADIRVSKDNKYYICHDDKFLPYLFVDTSLHNKPMSGYTWDQLKNLEVKNGTYQDKLISVEEYLDICKQNNVVPLLELKWTKGINTNKQDNLPGLVKLVENKGLIDKAIFMSSMKPVLTFLRNQYPTLKLQYLVGNEINETIIKFCIDNKISLDAAPDGITKDVVDKIHNAGLLINVYTINNLNIAKKMKNLGVDMITTDNLLPEQFVD